MTVTHSFLEVREENPDIDVVVRSLLLARAQNGATISNIKEDYFKETGLHFPVYKNIVDFLLSIPQVSAVCTERGTLIFNVVPTEKTKHLYDLVMHQKPSNNQRSSLASSSSGGHNFYYSNRNRSSWGKSHRNYYVPSSVSVGGNQPEIASSKSVSTAQPSTSEKSQSQCGESDDFAENNNFVYQDNCNYLFNRLCNQRNDLPPLSYSKRGKAVIGDEKLPEDPNNFDVVNNFQALQPQYNCGIYVDYPVNVMNPPQPPVMGPPTEIGDPRYSQQFRNAATSSPIRSILTSNDSLFGEHRDYTARILDFKLLGDDFLLYMARMELNCKFKKNEKVLQSGLCVSGQTIRGACQRIVNLDRYPEAIIVNIGSVDIMQGRPLVQIEHDFRLLLNLMAKKDKRPVLTTLAPLGNYVHDKNNKEKVERFNNYIRRMRPTYPVIDIWSCMVNESQQTLFDCYQKEPRMVTGARDPHLFWNKVGRQRVLAMIESSLEY